jgi:DNA-binding response OmpR family regulator
MHEYRPRILISESDPRVRAAMNEALSKCDYVVQEVAAGEVAGDVAIKGWPDLIVLDPTFPGPPIREVIDRFSTIRMHARILVTPAGGDCDIVGHCYRVGVASVLRRPFTIDEFLACVEGSLFLPPSSSVFQRAGLALDLGGCSISYRGGRNGPVRVPLPPSALRMLWLLLQRIGSPTTHAQIITGAFQYDPSCISSTVVHKHAREVRVALEQVGAPFVLRSAGKAFILTEDGEARADRSGDIK